ncbi:MAG: hypothetical protein JKX95_09155 [Bacteroidia bacterium]|nr:hypothetical protein [Bacteroidia bacterium]
MLISHQRWINFFLLFCFPISNLLAQENEEKSTFSTSFDYNTGIAYSSEKYYSSYTNPIIDGIRPYSIRFNLHHKRKHVSFGLLRSTLDEYFFYSTPFFTASIAYSILNQEKISVNPELQTGYTWDYKDKYFLFAPGIKYHIKTKNRLNLIVGFNYNLIWNYSYGYYSREVDLLKSLSINIGARILSKESKNDDKETFQIINQIDLLTGGYFVTNLDYFYNSSSLSGYFTPLKIRLLKRLNKIALGIEYHRYKTSNSFGYPFMELYHSDNINRVLSFYTEYLLYNGGNFELGLATALGIRNNANSSYYLYYYPISLSSSFAIEFPIVFKLRNDCSFLVQPGFNLLYGDKVMSYTSLGLGTRFSLINDSDSPSNKPEAQNKFGLAMGLEYAVQPYAREMTSLRMDPYYNSFYDIVQYYHTLSFNLQNKKRWIHAIGTSYPSISKEVWYYSRFHSVYTTESLKQFQAFYRLNIPLFAKNLTNRTQQSCQPNLGFKITGFKNEFKYEKYFYNGMSGTLTTTNYKANVFGSYVVVMPNIQFTKGRVFSEIGCNLVVAGMIKNNYDYKYTDEDLNSNIFYKNDEENDVTYNKFLSIDKLFKQNYLLNSLSLKLGYWIK